MKVGQLRYYANRTAQFHYGVQSRAKNRALSAPAAPPLLPRVVISAWLDFTSGHEAELPHRSPE